MKQVTNACANPSTVQSVLAKRCSHVLLMLAVACAGTCANQHHTVGLKTACHGTQQTQLSDRSLVTYLVTENTPPGTLIADMGADFPLKPSPPSPTRSFSVVSAPTQDVFSVDELTGDWFVRGRLDREELCAPSSECCLVVYYVAIQRSNVFEMVKVLMQVIDINGNSPVSRGLLLPISISVELVLDCLHLSTLSFILFVVFSA